jgi:hypothetical protein
MICRGEPTVTVDEHSQFRATCGGRQGFGSTPQEALERLSSQLGDDVVAPIVIWPYNRGDIYFTAAQHQRLQELRSKRPHLSQREVVELEQLLEAEFEAAIQRTQALPLVKS